MTERAEKAAEAEEDCCRPKTGSLLRNYASVRVVLLGACPISPGDTQPPSFAASSALSVTHNEAPPPDPFARPCWLDTARTGSRSGWKRPPQPRPRGTARWPESE